MKRWLFFSVLAHVGLLAFIVMLSIFFRPRFQFPVLTVQLVSALQGVERRAPEPSPPKREPVRRRETKKTARVPVKPEIQKPAPKVPPLRSKAAPEERAPQPESPPAPESRKPVRPDLPPGPSVEVAVRDPNFNFPYYDLLITRKLNAVWEAPPLNYGNPVTEVVILFLLRRDGSLKSAPRIEQSSGNVYFDQAALRAVLRAAPFPPLPNSYYGDSLTVHYRFLYAVGG